VAISLPSHNSRPSVFFCLSECCGCWPVARFVLVILMRVEEEQVEEEDDRETSKSWIQSWRGVAT
jgi:hypothetical protein